MRPTRGDRAPRSTCGSPRPSWRSSSATPTARWSSPRRLCTPGGRCRRPNVRHSSSSTPMTAPWRRARVHGGSRPAPLDVAPSTIRCSSATRRARRATRRARCSPTGAGSTRRWCAPCRAGSTCNDRILLPFPLAFTGGLAMVMAALWSGATLVLEPAFEPGRALRAHRGAADHGVHGRADALPADGRTTRRSPRPTSPRSAAPRRVGRRCRSPCCRRTSTAASR